MVSIKIRKKGIEWNVQKRWECKRHKMVFFGKTAYEEHLKTHCRKLGKVANEGQHQQQKRR